jgi:hypothetical protein
MRGRRGMRRRRAEKAQAHQRRARVVRTDVARVDLRQRNVLLRRMREGDVAGPKQIAGMPAAFSSAASVHADIPTPARLPLALAAHPRGAHDWRVRADVARTLRHEERHFRDELRPPRPNGGARATHLGHDIITRLSGQRPTLDSQHASVGIGRHADATLDRRRMQRRATEQRMSCVPRAPRRRRDRARRAAIRHADCVDAEVPPASMRRSPRDHDLDPDESTMSRASRRGTSARRRSPRRPRTPRSSMARVPILSYSSSAATATMISPVSGSRAACHAAAHRGADAALHVCAPRP